MSFDSQMRGWIRRCTPVSVTLKIAAGEALTLFGHYDQVRATCLENPQKFGCATEVFSALDIAEDARLSGAELSRALRALLFFTTYAVIADGRKEASAPPEDGWPRHFVPTTALLASSAGSIVLTPLLARNLSTTLRHWRLRFTEQSLLLWMWMWQVG